MIAKRAAAELCEARNPSYPATATESIGLHVVFNNEKIKTGIYRHANAI